MTPVELFWPAMIGVVLLGVFLVAYYPLTHFGEWLQEKYQGWKWDRRVINCDCSKCLTKEWENR